MEKNLIPDHLVRLIKESFDQYIALCDGLMDYRVLSYQEKSNWTGSPHGLHIRFSHKYTGQVVEAPYTRMRKPNDLDTYFWFEFVSTTSEFQEIQEYVDNNTLKISPSDLVSLFFNSSFLDQAKTEIPDFRIGDFIQIRPSAFKEEFHSVAHWDLKYYYEDRIKYISWPVEGNFEDVGGSLCTLLGGTKTRIKNLIRENSEIKEIHTDLFIIYMPFAYETQQFKSIHPIQNYTTDRRVSHLVEMLSLSEHLSRSGELTPGQRDHNKMIYTQKFFEGMKKS